MGLKGCLLGSFVGLIILNSLFSLALGISEAYFLAKYDSFSDECREIWKWILAACVFDIVLPVITCCGLTNLLDDDKKNNTPQLLIIGQLIIAIWSAVTYYNINTSCHDFWTSNAPELYTFVMVHFVCLWIMVGISGLLIVIGCLSCFGLATKELTSNV
jgi:hypothetical protein